MNAKRKFACLALTTALALTCALAGGEVVRFQDGRYLKVEGHQFHGEAVKLMMANRSVLVLPLDRIDSIRSGKVTIYSADAETPAPRELQAVVRKHQPPVYPETVAKKRG